MTTEAVPTAERADYSAEDMQKELVVDVSNLSIRISGGAGLVVNDVSLQVRRGEILGLLGESGSGKTTIGLSLLGHVGNGLEVSGGSVNVAGHEMLSLPSAAVRRLRGNLLSYVPQDPGTALDPATRLGTQIHEMMLVHGMSDDAQRVTRVCELMQDVRLPDDPEFLRRYPHELSGGQQQRFAIAMAFANRPALVVMDEPTTGLDVATERRIMEMVSRLRDEHGTSVLFVSHDIGVLSRLSDRVAVLYAGRVVEAAPVRSFICSARHPYTLGLLNAVPDADGRHEIVGIRGRVLRAKRRGSACDFSDRCDFAVDACSVTVPDVVTVEPGHEVMCGRLNDVVVPQRLPVDAVPVLDPTDIALKVAIRSASHGKTRVLENFELELERGSCLAIVGQSGSGKTTAARCIAGLHHTFDGAISLTADALPRKARDRSRDSLRRIQYVFQNPYSSLNPRRTIGDLVAQPAQIFFGLRGSSLRAVAVEALNEVELGEEYLHRFPHQLSGGERQRVAIGRAIAARPEVLICDEITSALDVSVQASIINMLRRLQRENGLSMVFITHDLALVSTLADRVALLEAGRVSLVGPTQSVIKSVRSSHE